jgi:hypothetical protein
LFFLDDGIEISQPPHCEMLQPVLIRIGAKAVKRKQNA